MKKGFRYEIVPTMEQKEYLNRVLGCTRFVYNNGLALKIKEYESFKESPLNPKPNVSSTGLAYLATPLREEFEFLKETPYAAIQQKLIDLGKGFDGFFRNIKLGNKPGFPKFKSKRKNRDSFRLTQANFNIKDNSLYIAKLKTPIKVFWSRTLFSKPSSVTISKTPTGKYYASFVCEYESNRQSGKGVVGIDVGLKTYAVTSKGEEIENPKFLKKSLKKLARAQRKHSKKQKDSSNRKKARIKVAKLHERVANQRKDFQHKVTTKLVNENQVLVLESLNLKGMIKNRKLSRSIADASWGRFKELLKYKISESNNGQLIFADPFFPSTQLCSHCNQYPKVKLELKDREHSCKCGNRMDRDLNAAMSLETMGRVFLKNRSEYKGVKIVIAPKYEDFLFYSEYRPV